MSRNISASVTSISQRPETNFRLLVEVDSLASGMTRACSGRNFIMVGANTYSPVGGLGGLEKIQEESEVYPRAATMWFAAISSSQMADMLSETLFNRPVRVFRTFLTDSYTIVSTPELCFSGRINTVELHFGDPDKGNYFEIEVESRLRRPPRAQYFNRETLWTVYNASGDTFFDYVSRIATYKSQWAAPDPAPTYPPGLINRLRNRPNPPPAPTQTPLLP